MLTFGELGEGNIGNLSATFILSQNTKISFKNYKPTPSFTHTYKSTSLNH